MWRDQTKVAGAEPPQQVVERPSDVVRSVWTSRCHPEVPLSLVSTITDHIRLLCTSAQIVEPRCDGFAENPVEAATPKSCFCGAPGRPKRHHTSTIGLTHPGCNHPNNHVWKRTKGLRFAIA